jgi:hypothetical protein
MRLDLQTIATLHVRIADPMILSTVIPVRLTGLSLGQMVDVIVQLDILLMMIIV